MGQLGAPKPALLVWIKNLFHQYFLFRLGYPHAKFKNNLVIFDWFRIFPKISHLGPPKPLFWVLIKNLFHQYVLLRLGYPHTKFQMFKLNFSGSDYTLPWQKVSFKKVFFKLPLWPLSKMGVQFWMYVVKDHGFPILKWRDTSQLVQQFGC